MTDAYERAKADDEAWEREHGDTREKIERDARVIADNWSTYGAKSTFGAYDIIALMDRQAAITEEEARCKWVTASAEEIAELRSKVYELQAELDHARSCPDCGCCKWKEKVDELQAETDEWRELYNEMSHERCDALMRVDKLEAELDAYDQTHMLLPLDADGVPIRVGDMVFLNGREPFEVGGVRDTRNQWHVFPYDLQRWYAPLDLHHVTKRTIEDVLATFRFDAKNIYDDPTLNGNERVDELEALDERVAAEIRELMGVCDG